MLASGPRPFRFGIQASRAGSRAEWVALARRVEAEGYSSLTMPDHFSDSLAPVPALMCAADATDRLRVGALVWNNDLRHPLVLAKELATMDLLSDGRVDVGLGAGWELADYRQSGLAYDAPGVRLDRFEEALTIMERAFSGEPFSFLGDHYQIDRHEGRPAPVQRPHPPFVIGGGGPRVLAIAARVADVVSINLTLTNGAIDQAALESVSAAAVERKIGVVREAAGERLPDIELSVRPFVALITDDRRREAERLAASMSTTADELLSTPFAVIGTASQIADDLRRRRERWGFSYVLFGPAEMDAMAPVVAELSGT
jgi:probable F420-dependent oxidoreductase